MRRRSCVGERAVSPVVGVALLVAIVVVLSAAAAGFFLALADEKPTPPQVSVDFDYNSDAGEVTITHASGDDVTDANTGKLVVLIEGDGERARRTWASSEGGGLIDLTSASVTASDAIVVDGAAGSDTGDRTVSFEFESGDTVTLLWVSPSGETSSTLATDTLPTMTAGPAPIFDRDGTVVIGGTAIAGDDGERVTVGPSNAEVLGNLDDVDGDGTNELPYVDGSGNLTLEDSNGETQTLVSGSSSAAPRPTKARLAAASWDGSPRSVFYAGDSEDKIYRVAPGASPVEVADPDNGANGVLGPGDIDGDGTDELLFADGSQQVRYVEPSDPTSGTFSTWSDGQSGLNNGIGIGPPPDFDGDGAVSVVIADTSNDIKLTGVAESTRRPAQSSVSAAKSPATAADVDGDGEEEVVYLDSSSSEVKYIDDVGGSNTVKTLTDANGNPVTGDDELGVVS